MKKQIKITLLLETDRYDDEMTSDEFIRRDLLSEIVCACNYYHFIDMETTILNEDTEGEHGPL